MKHLLLTALLLTACHESVHYAEDSDSFVYDEFVKGDDYGTLDISDDRYDDSYDTSSDVSDSTWDSDLGTDEALYGGMEVQEDTESDSKRDSESRLDTEASAGNGECQIGDKLFYTVAITQNPETGIIDLNECGQDYHVVGYDEVVPGAQRYMYIDNTREPDVRCGVCYYRLIGKPVWCKLGVELDDDGLPRCVDGVECDRWAVNSDNTEFYCND